MPDKDSRAYCIWYPDIASQDTHRKVAEAFPDMRYQVGRPCAVAGYDELYRERELLPDVFIAEEARESGSHGSRRIFDHIKAMPTRYGVMNHYKLDINLESPQPIACLNADTAVLATLKGRRRSCNGLGKRLWRYFNTTVDWGAGEEGVKLDVFTLTNSEIALPASLLPFDLPTMHKDLVIPVSAMRVISRRYARIRRPGRSVEYELRCLVPGVYRSTAMALWLA
ncbi:hypothetical protein J3459_010948 [Metarhizium acridum]|nr:hypothetical protein J3459_010948 [Metarhizium acridum]